MEALTKEARTVIEQYLHLPIGNAPEGIAVPYFNNRRQGMRAGLRALSGKGSPAEILEEAELFSIREKQPLLEMDAAAASKFLVDHRLGIDCSGLAYHVLDAESKARGKGSLSSRISFPKASFFRKIIACLRPAQNVGADTFAHIENSREITVSEAKPGDIIVMTHKKEERSFDHIVLITETSPKALSYINSIAWPSDGKYGHGVRNGSIEITDPRTHIKNQIWTEAGKTGALNYTHERALKADDCSLRRLNWF